VDFDPTAATATLAGGYYHNAFIAHYDTAGNFLSVERPVISENDNWIYGLCPLSSGEVFATGYYTHRTDFDPSAGTYELFASNHGDYFLTQYHYCTAVTASVATVPSCAGDSTGSITLNASGSGLTYNWISIGATTPVVSNLAPGMYTCVITDACGTSDTVTASVSTHPQIVLSSSQSNVLCHGDSTGSASVSASGGVGALSYLWSLSLGTDSAITAVPAGTYSCHVTDSMNCSIVMNVTITEPPVMSAAPVLTPPATCVSADGAISLALTGGTPNYSFAWNTTDTTGQLTGLSPGIYSCTITDQNGCILLFTDSLQPLSGYPLVSISVSPDTLCTNSGSVALGGASPAGGTWSGTYMTGSLFNTSNSGIGSFAVTYSFTDVTGCSAAATDSVWVDACLGVDDNSSDQIRLYPVPATEVVMISTGTPGMMELANALGEVLYAQWLTAGTTAIDVSTLAPGIYNIRFLSEEQWHEVQSLIITR
jgi:hypothetical protein